MYEVFLFVKILDNVLSLLFWRLDILGKRCYLIVILTWWLEMLSTCQCTFRLFVCLLWKNICSGPLPILNWIVWVFTQIYFIFWIFIHSWIHGLQTLSPIALSFALQRLFYDKLTLLLLLLCFCCKIQTIMTKTNSKSLLLSCRSLMVSDLTSKFNPV